jgi:hypothetical protein
MAQTAEREALSVRSVATAGRRQPWMTSVAAGQPGGVEVRGFEPLASSVRVISGSPPCRPAFRQVEPDRQGRS